MLAEHGSCLATHKGTAEFNPYSWTEAANMLYVDQPVGTGWSYGKTGDRSEISSLDLIAFLGLFFEAFPSYRDRELHLAGESFGGRFVTSLAVAIMDYNAIVSDSMHRIRLSSILIGNGWTSPKDQLPSVYDVGCHPYKGLERFFNSTECDYVASIYDRCERLLETCEVYPLNAVCFSAGQFCDFSIPTNPEQPTQQYDRRKDCSSPHKCFPRLLNAVNLLNSESTWAKLEIASQTPWENAKSHSIHFYAPAVFDAFVESGDLYMSSIKDLSRIIGTEKSTEHTIPVLYYATVADLLGNPVGIQRFLDRLSWPGHALFRNSEWNDLKWLTAEGKSAGRVRGTPGLYFAELEDAGRFAATDQPESLLNLVKLWLEGLSRNREDLKSVLDSGNARTKHRVALQSYISATQQLFHLVRNSHSADAS